MGSVIRGGMVADRSGEPARRADMLLETGRIVRVGEVSRADADEEIDANGLLVAPGFINVLSHAYFSLLDDPRGLSDLYQRVTTEIFGDPDVVVLMRSTARESFHQRALGVDAIRAGSDKPNRSFPPLEVVRLRACQVPSR